jgi:hypothetical protein
MTPIGNPQIGMVWTCMRNVKSPIKGILSPVNGRELWELGNATTSTEERSQDGSFWRLIPSLRKPDQEHIKEAFASDIALGYCKMINEPLPLATPTQQYGVRYVTVTSTITDAATAAMTDLAGHPASNAGPIPLQTKAASLSPVASTTSVVKPTQVGTTTTTTTIIVTGMPNRPMPGPPKPLGGAPGASHSKTWENNLDGFRGSQQPNIRTEITATVTELVVQTSYSPPSAFTIHTELAEPSFMVPTAVSIVSQENGGVSSAVPVSPASAPALSDHGGMSDHSGTSMGSSSPAMPNGGNPMGGSSGSGAMHGSPGSHESDSILAVEKPAPLFINNHLLSPQSGHNYLTDDGQVLVRDGPPILLSSGESGSDHNMHVNLISGSNGRDVLIVDGSSQTLGLSASTGAPNSGRSGSSSSGHEGMDIGAGSYSIGASVADMSSASPSSPGKARPAQYEGLASTVVTSWLIFRASVFCAIFVAF